MAVDPGFRDFVAEQLAVIGPVQIRSMFGGAGVFKDGRMFALIADAQLYFKADPSTVPRFEAEAMEPFTYETRSGRRSVMSYWRVPERLYDDPDEMQVWAREACAVAADNKTPKRKTARRKRSNR